MSWVLERLQAMGLAGGIVNRGKDFKTRCICRDHEDRNPSCYICIAHEDWQRLGLWHCFSCEAAGSWSDLERELGIAAVAPPPAPARAELASFLERGFTPAIMDRWGILYNEDTGETDIPCHDWRGTFITYMHRAPPGRDPRWRYETGFKTSEQAFGAHRLAEYCRVVLVEGSLDAIWVQEAGAPGIALLGSQLSGFQLDLLEQLGVRKATLCFDNDDAGRRATVEVGRALRSRAIWPSPCALPRRYKDIQEVPLDKVLTVLSRSHVLLNGHDLLSTPRLRGWNNGGGKR